MARDPRRTILRAMKYRFGEFELDVAARVLVGPAGTAALQPRALSVLIRLVEQRHRAITIPELLETVWAGEVVTPASVTQAVRSIRRALGDEGSIRTVRRHGYQFVVRVAGDDGMPDRRFVGRDAELAALEGALAKAASGGARLMLVEGEAGIGKTSLLRAFVDLLPGRSVAFGRGSAHPQGDAPPFWPWIGALQELEGRTGQGAIFERLQASDGTALDRYRRFDEVRGFLARRAMDRTIVVLLEDLHWADASTLQLLQFVLRESARPRLLVVATWRTAHGPMQALDELRALPRTVGLRLGGLDRVAIASLAGDAPLDADKLLARTGGNPLFITELLRHRADGGGSTLPSTVRAVIGARLDRLPATARRVLEAAAVLGDAAELPLIASVAGEPGARGLLVELASTGLVRVDDERVLFSHALVGEYLDEKLDPRERERLHAAAADALEERETLQPGRWCDAIAVHSWRAGPSADARRTLERCLAAARIASGRVAHAEAARHYDHALDAAGSLAGFETVERAQLLLRAAEAHHWAGNRAEADARLAGARHIAIARGDEELLARSALGLGMVVYMGETGGTNVEALRSLDEALQALPPKPGALRCALEARVSMLSYWSGLQDAAREYAGRAIEGAGRVREPVSAALAAMADYLVHLGPDDDGDRAERARRLVETCAASQRPDLELAARMWRIQELLAAGDADAFRAAMHDCRRRLEQHGHPLLGHFLDVLELQLAGTADACAPAIAGLHARLLESRNPNIETVTAAHRVILSHDEVRWDALSGLLVEARRTHPNMAVWGVLDALLALRDGRLDEARTRCATLLADPRIAEVADIQWLPTTMLLGEVVATAGDPSQIARVRLLLDRSAGRHGVFGMPVVYLAPVDHVRGLLAAAAGDRARAVELLGHAEHQALELGAARAARLSRDARRRVLDDAASAGPAERRRLERA